MACPKCGEMLVVQPPEGWRPGDGQPSDLPPPRDSAASTKHAAPVAAGPNSGLESSDFEDIESVLANTKPHGKSAAAAARAKSAAAAMQQSRRPASQAGPMPLTATPTPPSQNLGTHPNLGTHHVDQWTSPETKRRRTLILIAAASLLTILIGTTLTIYAFSPKRNPRIAQSQVDNDTDPNRPNTGEPDQESPAQSGSENGPTPGDSTPAHADTTVDPQVPVDSPDPSLVDSSANEGDTPLADSTPIAESPPGENLIGGSESVPVLPHQIAPIANSRLFGDFLRQAQPSLREDEMTIVLNRIGTSIADLRVVVSRAVPMRWVGLAPYYIERSEMNERTADLESLLAIHIAQVQYREVEPLAILREISLLLNIPISIDDAVLDSKGDGWNRPVNVIRSQLTVGELLHDVATAIDLDIKPVRHGLLVTLPGIDDPVTRAYVLPPLTNASDEAYLRFAEALKLLIAPGTWGSPHPDHDPLTVMLNQLNVIDQDDDQGDGQDAQDDAQKELSESSHRSAFNAGEASIANHELVVTHTLRTHLAIERLLAKLAAAHELHMNIDAMDARQSLDTRWQKFAPRLSEPWQVPTTSDSQLDLYFQRLAKTTGTLILVDWEALCEAGWGIQTTFPGSIRAVDWESFLRDIEHATGLTISARTEHIGKLTTLTESINDEDVEVYPIGQILKRGIEPHQLEDLLWRVMAWYWEQGRGRLLVYEPNYQCFIVAAPQRLQRQLDAILIHLAQP
ncbi:MAG TPA: hypothetical protein PKD54_10895 [Pirellulaceae bacterium]|nr:hypothetical protein [Pirellulaceae bacterium]